MVHTEKAWAILERDCKGGWRFRQYPTFLDGTQLRLLATKSQALEYCFSGDRVVPVTITEVEK